VCDRGDLFGGRALIFAVVRPQLLALKEREYDMELSEKVKGYANSINDSWHKSTDSIVGSAVADADKKLKAADKSKLFPILAFSKATFSKLAKIDSNEHLLSKDLRPSLPPSYSILYELAMLSEEQLKLAHADGVLNANMTRNGVERWVVQHKEGSEEAEGETFHLFATLRTPVHFDKTKEKELEAALDKLMAEFGIAIQRSRNLEEDALARISRKVHDHIRKGAQIRSARRSQSFIACAASRALEVQ
jgi:hypothetical protein